MDKMVSITVNTHSQNQRDYVRLSDKEIEQFIKKNTDYGDSAFIPVPGVGKASLCNWVRACDKIKRLNRLMDGNTAMVSDESVKDTLMDLAVYCKLILLCMEQEAVIEEDQEKVAFKVGDIVRSIEGNVHSVGEIIQIEEGRARVQFAGRGTSDLVYLDKLVLEKESVTRHFFVNDIVQTGDDGDFGRVINIRSVDSELEYAVLFDTRLPGHGTPWLKHDRLKLVRRPE